LVAGDATEERGTVPVTSEYGIVELMTASELHASGMTVRHDIPELEEVPIGPGGTASIKDLGAMAGAPEAAKDVLATLKIFPNAQVEGVLPVNGA
jgi:hypothetical protein